MDGQPRSTGHGILLTLLSTLLISCSPRPPVDQLPRPDETLASAGKRLSRSLPPGDLTVLASRGDRVLAALTSTERDALARGHLRFRVDRPADVYVAAPRGFAPFWLADQDFQDLGQTLKDSEVVWNLYRKRFAPGWVGLGVNGLDRRPPAHYAVFLVSDDGSSPVPSLPDNSPWQITTATDGVNLATGLSRPLASIPAPIRGATLLRTSDDLRHSTLLARGRVWKTHVVSTRQPDQLTVSFGSDTSAELVFSWRTAPEVSRSLVRIRKPGDETVREVEGGSEPVALREVLNDPLVLRHTARAFNLEPDTTYEYSVGDGSHEGTSPWSRVKTAPGIGADVSLLYMGDPQCGLEGWGKLLSTARRHRPDAAALLIAGDLVDRGNERTNWDHFFLRASGVFERIPLMPCVGNHEYLDRGPWLYRSNFALPPNGPEGVAPDLVYSFEVGNAVVAVLDSTLAVSDPAQASLQADWLDSTLSNSPRTWKLVMFHHPVYASHPRRESLSLRDAWVPVFDKHHVDLVLQGHDHAYLRTYPMRADARADSPAEGTVYVVSVSGDKYYDQAPRDYAEVGFTGVSTYQSIDLLSSQNRLVYRSFDATGRERDSFTIEKPAGERRVARSRNSSADEAVK